MLNIKYILENKELVRDKLISRNFDITVFDNFLSLAQERGKLMSSAQEQKSKLTKLSKQFGIYKNDLEKLSLLKKEIEKVKSLETQLTNQANELNFKLDEILATIPNLPLDEIPFGKDENDNKVINVYEIGTKKDFEKSHYEIASELNMIDIPRAVKQSGSRFVIYKNEGSKLVRALINFMLDLHKQKGYDEFLTPYLVRSEMLFGTGQLPKFKEDMFKVENSDLYLIPTAEITLTNYYNNEIVNLDKPFKACAYTECFRSEVGSSGKDTKGIIRQHQFKKVEIVKVTTKDDAIKEFNLMLEDAKNVLFKLEIPFREVLLSTGDMGFSSRKTIDLELWLPSESKYREVSSVSYMGDFQARRAKIRYKNQDQKTEYAHTMNGSALAVDRLVAAIIEQYLDTDGNLVIPKVLVPYMGMDKIYKK